MKIQDFLELSSRSLVTKTSRTLLTVLGMGVGIGAVLFLVSLGFGLRNVLIEEITTDKSFVILDVTQKDSGIAKLTIDNVRRLKRVAGVHNVSPVKEIAAQAKFDKLKSEVQILSVDSSFFELSGLDSDIDKGRPFKKNEPMSIVIAESLAQLFDTNGISPIGKTVRVDVVMDVEPTQEGGATTMIATRDFRVIGILGGHMENVIYMHSNNFQEYTDIFSMVKIETVSSDILQEVRGEILKKGFAVSAISDTVEQANQIFGVITTVLAIFGAIALAVSAIGMFNTMTITLLERTPEIGVMKSIGASKLDVVKLFITEALIMGFLGSVAGVLIGIITAKIVNITFNSLAIRFGGEAISVFYTPPLFIVLILIGGSFIGLLTGVFPARRASKIDALNALRYK